MDLAMTLFISARIRKNFGRLDPEEKNRISHRGKALALIKDELDKSEEMYAEDNDSK